MNEIVIDYLILGGGCSGLSLIDKIIDKNINHLSFIILEKKEKYLDDKSWCFWDKNESIFDELSEKKWKKFVFSLDNKTNILESCSYNYYYIRSINFYEKIIKKINNSLNIDLRLNEDILSVKKLESYYRVTTNKRIYTAKNILDTRPNLNHFNKYPLLFQSFIGFEIISDHQIPIKKNCAYLMRNMNVENEKFYFEYILPLKNNKFLFELTAFSKVKLPYEYLEKKIKKYLENYKIKNYDIIRKEYGVLPMGFVNLRKIFKGSNYFYTGTSAGAIRPSSGYAFLRIQNWAEACSLQLKKNGTLITFPKDTFFLKTLDKIFLKIIYSNIYICPKVFYLLTKRVSVHAFIKFMNGNASFIDYIKIILAMPKRIFIRCLLKI